MSEHELHVGKHVGAWTLWRKTCRSIDNMNDSMWKYELHEWQHGQHVGQHGKHGEQHGQHVGQHTGIRLSFIERRCVSELDIFSVYKGLFLD